MSVAHCTKRGPGIIGNFSLFFCAVVDYCACFCYLMVSDLFCGVRENKKMFRFHFNKTFDGATSREDGCLKNKDKLIK